MSSSTMAPDAWVVCSACRVPIRFGGIYFACSISTCNREPTRLFFCSVPCWDSHVATLRHRDAGAIEQRAPASASAVLAASAAPATKAVAPAASAAPAAKAAVDASSTVLSPASEDDILIVVSKVKKYIRERSGMNTSDAVAERLSDHVRAVCDESIRAAGRDGRKTVLDRDVPAIRR
jgi:hypothetical protein